MGEKAETLRYCPMPAHGMARDGLAFQINGKCAPEQRRKLFGNVIPHAKMPVPWRLYGVDIKPSALPKIIGPIIGNIGAARGCVWKNQGNPLLRRPSLRTRFGHGIFMGAGQS